MDAVFLSRLQFGLTAFFHFLFPPLTIGLATVIAIIEYYYWRRGKELYDQMARFWFKIFAILFAVGVASGITMEFQFGTNWSEYSKFVGDIFGAPLAAEGVFAFFLESTFVGLLLFGRDKISRNMRFASSVLVAVGSTLSAFWIIVANSWQQTPTAYRIEGGRAVLTDFSAAVFNPSTLPRFLHTVDAAYITGAFFVMGISAYFLLRNRNTEIAGKSLKIAIILALIGVLAQFFLGHSHSVQVAQTQPVKLAAFEGIWDTQTHASLNIIGFPDVNKEITHFSIGIPGLLSWMVHGHSDTAISGLKAFAPGDRPLILATYWSYRLMLLAAAWFAILVSWGAYLLFKGRLYNNRPFLIAAMYSMLLPVLVNELGWMAAEFGRQPWIVYGLLRTNLAASPLPAYQILLTIVLFILVYSGLLMGVCYLVKREVKKASGEIPHQLETGPISMMTDIR
ncbi:MAG TPA: cytochrome ubiquinol oxidase subunit I [Syntrophomonadaceae bacterium]|nr:cytochrome ubiquinol oxidase subunit I [Syntrophomonadaceae bacterium]